MFSVASVISTGGALLGLILVGFICCKLRIITYANVSALNRFNLQCCFLPLMMRSVYQRKLSEIDFRPVLVAMCSILTMYVIALICFAFPFKDKFKMYLSTMLPCAYINYLIVGIPIFDSIWGPEENYIISVLAISNDPISVPIYLILSNIYNIMKSNKMHQEANDGMEEKFSYKIILDILKRLFTNPIMLGLIVGFIWAGIGIPSPPFVTNLLNFLANAVLGICLFGVGAFLSEHSLMACNWIHFIVCILIRHVIIPSLAVCYSLAFGLPARLARQVVLMIGLPSASASYLLSEQAGIGPGVASTMIFWTTVLVTPFSIMWMYLLDAFNLFVE